MAFLNPFLVLSRNSIYKPFLLPKKLRRLFCTQISSVALNKSGQRLRWKLDNLFRITYRDPDVLSALSHPALQIVFRRRHSAQHRSRATATQGQMATDSHFVRLGA